MSIRKWSWNTSSEAHATMASRKVERLEDEAIRKWLNKYISTTVPRDVEAYGFNIKVRRIDLPEVARHKFSEDEIDRVVQVAMAERLRDFVDSLQEKYAWISNWLQEGRSGGWLVLITEDSVLDEDGFVPDRKKGEKRLQDLFEIEESIKENMRAMEQDLSSLKWWGIGPLDWLPGVNR